MTEKVVVIKPVRTKFAWGPNKKHAVLYPDSNMWRGHLLKTGLCEEIPPENLPKDPPIETEEAEPAPENAALMVGKLKRGRGRPRKNDPAQ